MALSKSVKPQTALIEFKKIDSKYHGITHKEHSAGYDLYTAKDKWIWPFKITKVPINSKIIIPDNTYGMIIPRVNAADMGLEVLGGIINESDWCTNCLTIDQFINVKRVGFFPRKLKAGTSIAQLVINPFVECHMLDMDSSMGDLNQTIYKAIGG